MICLHLIVWLAGGWGVCDLTPFDWLKPNDTFAEETLDGVGSIWGGGGRR